MAFKLILAFLYIALQLIFPCRGLPNAVVGQRSLRGLSEASEAKKAERIKAREDAKRIPQTSKNNMVDDNHIAVPALPPLPALPDSRDLALAKRQETLNPDPISKKQSEPKPKSEPEPEIKPKKSKKVEAESEQKVKPESRSTSEPEPEIKPKKSKKVEAESEQKVKPESKSTSEPELKTKPKKSKKVDKDQNVLSAGIDLDSLVENFDHLSSHCVLGGSATSKYGFLKRSKNPSQGDVCHNSIGGGHGSFCPNICHHVKVAPFCFQGSKEGESEEPCRVPPTSENEKNKIIRDAKTQIRISNRKEDSVVIVSSEKTDKKDQGKEHEEHPVHSSKVKKLPDVGATSPIPTTTHKTFSTDASKVHLKAPGNSALDIISGEPQTHMKKETNPKFIADHDIGWSFSSILPVLNSKVIVSINEVPQPGIVILANFETLTYHVRLEKDGTVLKTKFADLLYMPLDTTVITYGHGLKQKLIGLKGVISEFDEKKLTVVIKDVKTGNLIPKIGVENLLFLPTVGTRIVMRSTKAELGGKIGVVTANDYGSWMCTVDVPGFKSVPISPYKLEPADSIPFWNEEEEE